MKKTSYLAAALLLAGVSASCEQEGIYDPVTFRPTLDAANTYRVGEPVVFNFEGNAEFITIWNGDTGHEYRYKDRELAPEGLFRAAELELKIYQQYGKERNMEIYMTDQFTGLKGRYINPLESNADINKYAAEDRASIQAIVDANFAGWDKFVYNDKSNAKFESYKADITKYEKNFTLAIHLVSPTADGETMRTYAVNPRITTQFDKFGTYKRKFSQLSFTPFRMSGLYTDKTPYINSIQSDLDAIFIVNQNGIVKFRGQKSPFAGADIAFQGFKIGAVINAKELPDLKYGAVDQWIFMQPLALNTIPSDTGVNIKGYADDTPSYSYIYTEPGTYTVTFVAGTGNYEGQSSVVHEMTVTIVDPVTAPAQK